jgi:uridine phosphorylase
VPQEPTAATINVRRYIREVKRYVDVGKLDDRLDIAGAVVHDSVGAVDKALVGCEFLSFVAPVSECFPVRVVIQDRRCVLLIETGMGSTGSSIVSYELALQLKPENCRIVKVGTCVSTRRGIPVGTVLVPGWAVADEGVTHWDARLRVGNSPSPQDAFQNTVAVRASANLTGRWRTWLTNRLRPPASIRDPHETAIWTADTFYPLHLLPGFFSQLADGYRLDFDPEAATLPTPVAGVVRSDEGTLVIGWDMECSALFSATEEFQLEACAAIVVSYTADQLCAIGKGGETGRSDDEKKSAHAVEEELIREAIRFLLSEHTRPCDR